jgi:putative transposase
MAKRLKHSPAEIAAKLAEAHELATKGNLQSEIARRLGVSVMTLHRWRKASTIPAGDSRTRLAELQQENFRLRRLVTDLLLEKIKLEENLAKGPLNRASRVNSCVPSRGP